MRLAASPLLNAGPSDIWAESRVGRHGQQPRLGAPSGLKPRRQWAFILRGVRNAIDSTLIIGVLVAFAREQAPGPADASPAVPRPVLSAPQPVWHPAADIAPLYALDEARFAVRLHPNLGREDAAVVGALGEDGPHLRLVLRRGPVPPPSTFFIDVARLAGEVGLSVARSGRAEAVPTKFGPAEVAEAVLVGPVERACLAFRFERRDTGFGGSGWLCGPAERPATGHVLACLLDRLALAPTADDPAVAALFAQAERRRFAACEPSRAVAGEAAPERIPAELFLQGGETEPAGGPPKPRRSRQRERS